MKHQYDVQIAALQTANADLNNQLEHSTHQLQEKQQLHVQQVALQEQLMNEKDDLLTRLTDLKGQYDVVAAELRQHVSESGQRDARVTQLVQECAHLQTIIDNLSTTKAALETESAKRQRELSELHIVHDQLVHEHNQCPKQMSDLTVRISTLEEQQQSHVTEKDSQHTALLSAYAQIETLSADQTRLNSELQILSDGKAELMLKFQKALDEIQELKSVNDAKEDKLCDAVSTRQHLDEELTGMRQECAMLQEKIDELTNENRGLHAELCKKMSEISDLQQQLDTTVSETNAVAETLRTVQSTVISRDEQIANIQQQLAAERDEIINKVKLLQQMTDDRDSLRRVREELQTALNISEQKVYELTSLHNSTQKRCDDAEEQLQQLLALVSQLRVVESEYTILEQQHASLQELYAQQQRQLQALQQDYDQLQGNLDSLDGSRNELTSQLRMYQELNSQQARELDEQSAENARNRSQLQELNDQLQRLTDDRDATVIALREQLAHAEHSLRLSEDARATEREEVKEFLNETAEKVSSQEHEITQLQEQLQQHQKSYTAVSAQLDHMNTDRERCIREAELLREQLATEQLNYERIEQELSSCKAEKEALQKSHGKESAEYSSKIQELLEELTSVQESKQQHLAASHRDAIAALTQQHAEEKQTLQQLYESRQQELQREYLEKVFELEQRMDALKQRCTKSEELAQALQV